jgi:hypothetical protein
MFNSMTVYTIRPAPTTTGATIPEASQRPSGESLLPTTSPTTETHVSSSQGEDDDASFVCNFRHYSQEVYGEEHVSPIMSSEGQIDLLEAVYSNLSTHWFDRCPGLGITTHVRLEEQTVTAVFVDGPSSESLSLTYILEFCTNNHDHQIVDYGYYYYYLAKYHEDYLEWMGSVETRDLVLKDGLVDAMVTPPLLWNNSSAPFLQNSLSQC